MTKWGRAFGVVAGAAMMVGGFLASGGSRWGYLLFSIAVAFLAVGGFLAAQRRYG
jgi:hypothetical protein